MELSPELLGALWRGLSVALFVGAVVYVMDRAPPFIGGVVLALPMVVGPSYFFLGLQQDALFLHQAIVIALGMIGAVLCFLTLYIRLIGQFSAPLSLLGALAAWMLAAVLVRHLPLLWPVMLAFTAAIGLLAWRVNRGVVQLGFSDGKRAPAPTYDVLLRAASAGLLVVLVTLLANRLGPLGSGLLASFPVALSVICLFLLRRYSRQAARAALASTQRGLVCHVVFFLSLLGLEAALPAFTLGWRFLLAALASAATATAVALLTRRA
ncbi:hypothetical protein [Ferrovibrio sp.]|uniref:hypothetical protein n=1 Tax=Ferrovibrio sp. TaxID=1917215 RepID=UPI003D2B9BCE